jgi:AcrR family transcriptional regulator
VRTDRTLVAAAAVLLDTGGESAVTVRAVAAAAGITHNAPYKHSPVEMRCSLRSPPMT